MKRMLLLLLVAGFFPLTLAGCNTMAGVGEDMESAGEKVQDKAEDCKDPPC